MLARSTRSLQWRQMGLFTRMLRRDSYSVSLNKEGSTFLYRERNRCIQVAGESMAHGYAIYVSSIKHWENKPAEPINDAERQRIAANIRQYFVDRGEAVYLS